MQEGKKDLFLKHSKATMCVIDTDVDTDHSKCCARNTSGMEGQSSNENNSASRMPTGTTTNEDSEKVMMKRLKKVTKRVTKVIWITVIWRRTNMKRMNCVSSVARWSQMIIKLRHGCFVTSATIGCHAYHSTIFTM